MTPKTPGYRVLIKPDTLEQFDPTFAKAKALGIDLSATEEKNERTAIDTGVVLQIGPVAYSDRGGAENWCKVGDRVSYARHGGKHVKDPEDASKTYLVLNDEDIILVWETNNG
jgi:co-chaperonin GroES (HSP10)